MHDDTKNPNRCEQPRHVPPVVADRVLASMIEAEVNEGGPPSPVPCDTPLYGPVEGFSAADSERPPPHIDTASEPGPVIHLPFGKTLDGATTSTLLRTPGVQLIRLVIPSGKVIPPHRSPGELLVQCVEGHVTLRCHEKLWEMRAGDMVHLGAGEVHSVVGRQDSSVIVTVVRLPAWQPSETTLVP